MNSYHTQPYPCLSVNWIYSLLREELRRDYADKHIPAATKQVRGPGCQASHSYHIPPHYHSTVGSTPSPSLCLFRLHLHLPHLHQPSQRCGRLGRVDDETRLDTLPTAMLSENAISKVTYPISATMNSTNTTLVAWSSSAER